MKQSASSRALVYVTVITQEKIAMRGTFGTINNNCFVKTLDQDPLLNASDQTETANLQQCPC